MKTKNKLYFDVPAMKNPKKIKKAIQIKIASKRNI